MTFKEAFAAARKKHGAKGTFTWNGKKYHTKYKEEVAAEKDKRKSSPKPKLRPESKSKEKTKVTPGNKSGESPKKTGKKTKVTPNNKSGESPKTKATNKPKVQTTAKQPKVETTASKTPSRSKSDSKSATSGTTRVSPSRPSYARSPEGAPKIAASTVKARESVEAGKKATGTPSTPTTNKQEKMGNTPTGNTRMKPAKDGKKPTFAQWVAAGNKPSLPEYKKAMKAAGFNRGGMVRSGSTDRRGNGMFYKSASPNKYK